MMLRHSLGSKADAGRVERAVARVLASEVRGADLGGEASTDVITDAVIAAMHAAD